MRERRAPRVPRARQRAFYAVEKPNEWSVEEEEKYVVEMRRRLMGR